MNFLFFFPSLFLSLFPLMSCQQITEGKSILIIPPFTQCFSSTHLFFLFTLLLPTFCISLIFIPFSVVIATKKSVKKQEFFKKKNIFNFLTTGYFLDKFFWEIIILYEKCFLAISVEIFKRKIERNICGIAILAINLFIALRIKPFLDNEMNILKIKFEALLALILLIDIFIREKKIIVLIYVILFYGFFSWTLMKFLIFSSGSEKKLVISFKKCNLPNCARPFKKFI